MNNYENGFTLGSLLRILLLLSLIIGSVAAYNKWQMSTQVKEIESILVDAKVRVENSLAIDEDANITIAEAVGKAQESAQKVDESIIQLKKLNNDAVEHQQKALKILTASRDLMRVQARAILNDAENRFYARKIESTVKGLTELDLDSLDQATVSEILAKLKQLKANREVIAFERNEALSNLLTATNDAKHLFREEALVNVEKYLPGHAGA